MGRRVQRMYRIDWRKMIGHYWEEFRSWLAFKIFPEQNLYLKLAKVMGEMKENERVIELIEQSSFRNKKAVIDLIEIKYTKLEDLKWSLDDASEDQTSSDAS